MVFYQGYDRVSKSAEYRDASPLQYIQRCQKPKPHEQS